MAASKPFEIVSADIHAIWSFKSSSSECPICKMHLESICVECESKGDPKNSCKVSQAECGHVFHKHCIDKYISQQKYSHLCPVCKTPYSTKCADMNNNEDWKKLIRKAK